MRGWTVAAFVAVVGVVGCDVVETAVPTGAATTLTAASTVTAGTGEANPSPTTRSPATTAPGDPGLIDRLTISVVATLNQPISITWHPDGTGPLVATKAGNIHLLADAGDVEVLDISDLVSTNSERGLLSITFDPAGDYLYAHWSNRSGHSVLSAWPWSDGSVDQADRIDLALIEQPFPNHNGGGLAFGPDGYLYWGQGDGGAGGDPLSNGQDGSTLLGSILRLDPDPLSGTYLIPAENPFIGVPAMAPEIWLTGLRNPWRISFDPLTRDLWISDVGQDAFEEIDRVQSSDAGANLGWNCFEGFETFAGCDVDDHLLPILTYGRELGQSVTGGYVYRGSAIPDLYASYVFGDFVSGRLWALPDASSDAIELPLSFDGVVTFAVDPEGELWLASISSGQVGRLEVG